MALSPPRRPTPITAVLVTTLLAATWLLAAAPTVGTARAEGLPDLGEAARGAFSEFDERRIGQSILREIQADPAYLDDPEVSQYLGDLGRRLGAALPDAPALRFIAIRDDTLNAFALPGGIIGVHTGLMLAAHSESELAGVVAHEIGHVSQQHIARMVADSQRVSWTSAAALALAILAARSNPQVANAAIAATQASVIQSQLNFTRANEREADRVGLQILRTAGFNTHDMAAFFERLQKYTGLYDNGAPAYLRTHPLTSERIADIENRVVDDPRPPVAAPEFRLIQARIRAITEPPRRAAEYFREQIERGPDEARRAAHYGLAVLALRARDPAGARAHLAKLGPLAASPAATTLALRARAAQESPAAPGNSPAAPGNSPAAPGNSPAAPGNSPAALSAAYRTALAEHPDYRPLAYAYADLLLDTGRAREAVDFLKQQTSRAGADPGLYERLAKSYAALGRRLLQHQAQAEAYALRGNPVGAVEQMEIARRSGDGNFYELSIVEARLKELRAQADELRKEDRDAKPGS